MALKVKIQHKGKDVEGYLYIDTITTGRGIQHAGNSGGMANVMMSNGKETKEVPLKDKYQVAVSYFIRKVIDGKESIIPGYIHFPYDLNSKKNIIETAYKILKTKSNFTKKGTVDV